MSKPKTDDSFTILEVANLLSITTQAVYKRLQQDSDSMNAHLTKKGGKKSLTKKGVEHLATLMGLENPFEKETKDEAPLTENQLVSTEAGQELLSYLRLENERLRNELDETKRDLKYTQELREQDRRTSETERNEAAEARKRADIMMMQVMKGQEKPRLLDRIFKRDRKNTHSVKDEVNI